MNGNERIFKASECSLNEIKDLFGYNESGLDEKRVKEQREKFGQNQITVKNQNTVFKRLFSAFVNPFNLVLTALAVFSYFSDVLFADPLDKTWHTVIIISLMVIISGVLKFVQETKSGDVAAKLSRMISRNITVMRNNEELEIPVEELVVGDIVKLGTGSVIPADLRIIECKDLLISQSALTGESEPVEKKSVNEKSDKKAVTELDNIVFLGSNVSNGFATCVVIAVGNDTMLGRMAKDISTQKTETTFEKGVSSVSKVLVGFMAVMVPIVFVINIITKGDWMASFMFAISIAVGLTPEMLPMVVTTTLSKGAVAMSKKKVLIKELHAIQNLGSIDVLCTDKTGTITQDKVMIQYYLDIDGRESTDILRQAYLNSNYQTGGKNLIDQSVISRFKEQFQGKELEFEPLSEIPFDFLRRRMSVVGKDKNGEAEIITKGAVEEILSVCTSAVENGEVKELDDRLIKKITYLSDRLNNQGMRVIAVAKKRTEIKSSFSPEDECDMTFEGVLSLLDPPKETTEKAIKLLKEYNVDVKVLTGDNEKVTKCICEHVGFEVKRVLMGNEIEKMNDEELSKAAEEATIFAKLSPTQKARVVTVLRNNGHSVGFMGDGINDAAALKASDVGISVDTAVDIAKEEAKVVLLEKDLMVLRDGIVEGRRVYANMIKYIKMTASSNFGNVFSVLAASIFLPFLPMASIQLLTLNLIYDISCIGIPWDNVDEEYIRQPKAWRADDIKRFMFYFGPASSVFDIITYIFMYFWICPLMMKGPFSSFDIAHKEVFESIFQTGWFIVSMWTQTLVIHMIRTKKIPFVESMASFGMVVMTASAIIIGTMLPFTPIAHNMQMCGLCWQFFILLFGVVAGYMILTTAVKKIYVRKYGELL